MKALSKLLLMVAIIFCSTVHFAKTSDWALSDAGVDYGLNLFGASYQLKGHTLSILVDQYKVLDHLDEQIRSGTYNSSLTRSYLTSHPLTYLMVSAIDASFFIIPRVYKDHPNLNFIIVNVRIKYENILGNSTVNSLLSFSMSRKLNNEINWVRFSPANAFDVYPSFRFSNLVWQEYLRGRMV